MVLKSRLGILCICVCDHVIGCKFTFRRACGFFYTSKPHAWILDMIVHKSEHLYRYKCLFTRSIPFSLSLSLSFLPIQNQNFDFQEPLKTRKGEFCCFDLSNHCLRHIYTTVKYLLHTHKAHTSIHIHAHSPNVLNKLNEEFKATHSYRAMYLCTHK